MKKTLLALAVLTTLAGAVNAVDRRTGTKKAARKAKTQCPVKPGCCAGMKKCPGQMSL